MLGMSYTQGGKTSPAGSFSGNVIEIFGVLAFYSSTIG